VDLEVIVNAALVVLKIDFEMSRKQAFEVLKLYYTR